VLKAYLGADSRPTNTEACREWTGKPAHDAPAIAAIVGVCREWLKSQEQKPRAAPPSKRQSGDKGAADDPARRRHHLDRRVRPRTFLDFTLMGSGGAEGRRSRRRMLKTPIRSLPPKTLAGNQKTREHATNCSLN
jgi:hypothetical protein